MIYKLGYHKLNKLYWSYPIPKPTKINCFSVNSEFKSSFLFKGEVLVELEKFSTNILVRYWIFSFLKKNILEIWEKLIKFETLKIK